MSDDSVELVETVIADHDAAALLGVLDHDIGAEPVGEIGLEAPHVRILDPGLAGP